MSHITQVETQVYDREVLLQVLEENGYAYEIERIIYFERRSILMDVVVHGARGFHMGFRRTHPDEAYTILYWDAGPKKFKSIQDKLLQQYARSKVLKEARQRNYVLVREKSLAGNRIQMVLRKIA